MDKSKSKDDLRAAGKKRLEEFRQKKQQKSSAPKSSGSSLKVPVEEEKPIEVVLSRPETPSCGDPQATVEIEHRDNESDLLKAAERPETLGKDSSSKLIENSCTSAVEVVTKDAANVSQTSGPVDNTVCTHKAFQVGDVEDTVEMVMRSEEYISHNLREKDANRDGNLYPEQSLGSGCKSSTSEEGYGSVTHLPSDKDTTLYTEPEQNTFASVEQSSRTGNAQSLVYEIKALRSQMRAGLQGKEKITGGPLVEFGDVEVDHQNSIGEGDMEDLKAARREVFELKVELLPQIDQLLEFLTEREVELVDLRRDGAACKEVVEQLRKEKLKRDSEIDQLRSDIQVLRQEKSEVADQLKASQAFSHSLESEKEDHLFKLMASTEKIQVVVSEKEEVRKQLTQTRDKCESIEFENRALREQKDSLAADNHRLGREIEDERERFREVRNQLDQLVAAAELEEERMREAVENLKALELAKTFGVESYYVQPSNAAFQVARLLKELEVDRALVRELTVENERLLENTRNEHWQFSTFITELQASETTKECELEDLKSQVSSMVAEKSELAQSLDSERRSSTQVREEFAQILADLNVKRDELKVLKLKLQESNHLVLLGEGQIKTLTRCLEDLELEMRREVETNAQFISQLQSELEEQRIQSGVQREEKARMILELQEMREQLESTFQCLSKCEATIEQRHRDLKLLGDSREKLSLELQVTRDEATRQNEESIFHQGEVRSLRQQLEDVNEKHLSSKQSLADVEAALSSFRELNLQHSREQQKEVEKLKADLCEDNARLETEFLALQGQLVVLTEDMDMLRKAHETEVHSFEDELREMRDVHTNLSSDLFTSKVECTRLLEGKIHTEREIGICKEQQVKLQEEMVVAFEKYRAEVAVYEESLLASEETLSMLKAKSLSSEAELTKALVEKDDVKQKLVKQVEQVKEIKSLIESLSVELTDVKHQLEVSRQENSVFARKHFSEMARLQGLVVLLEERDVKSSSDNSKLRDELQAEKSALHDQLEIFLQSCTRLKEENGKLTNQLVQSQEQMQILITDKDYVLAKLSADLDHQKNCAQTLSDEKEILLQELKEIQKQSQERSGVTHGKVEDLLKEVEELSQSKEQALIELTAAFQQAEKVERTRVELVSKLEVVEQQLEDLARDKDVLLGELDLSKHENDQLERLKAGMIADFQASEEIWKAELSELQRALDVSKELQSALFEEKNEVALDLATAKLRIEQMMNAHTSDLAVLKESVRCTEEEKEKLVSLLRGKDQQVQSFSADNQLLTSELELQRSKILSLTGEIAILTGEVKSFGDKVQAQGEDVTGFNQPSSSKEGFNVQTSDEHSAGKLEAVEDLTLSPTSRDFVSIEAGNALPYVESRGGSDLTAEGELARLKGQWFSLKLQLESSDEERRNLSEELAFLRLQLQQLDRSNSHALKDEESRHCIAGNEAADLTEITFESSNIHLDKLSALSDSEGVDPCSGVSRVAGQEQVRSSVQENIEALRRLSENERSMPDEGFAPMAGSGNQVSELKSEILETELKHSKETFERDNLFLANRVEMLEDWIVASDFERDIIAETLSGLERGMNQGSGQTQIKQEIVCAGDDSPSVASSDLGLLIKKLENAAQDLLPGDCADFISQRAKLEVVAYADMLCDKLLTGNTGPYHQLQMLRVQETEMKERLLKSEQVQFLLKQERESAVLASQEYADKLSLESAVNENLKDEVSALRSKVVELESLQSNETSSRSFVDDELRSVICKHWGENADVDYEIQALEQKANVRESELRTSNSKLESAVETIVQQANEIKGLLVETEKLSEELVKMNVERESLQANIAKAELKLDATREKLSLAVTKGKGVVQQRDALRQTLYEKTKLLEELKDAYEQEVLLKNAALQNVDARSDELEALRMEYEKLETKCSSLQGVVDKVDEVMLTKEQSVEELSSLIEDSMSLKDWQSSELSSRIVYLLHGTTKVLQVLEASNNLRKGLASTSESLAECAREAEGRPEMLALELSTVKKEKEEIVAHFEEIRSSLQLELEQNNDEKTHLTSKIRQLDSDVEKLKAANESMSWRLEQQGADIVGFEAEIGTLQRKLAEREQDWQAAASTYKSLEAYVSIVATNLDDINRSLPPFDGDINSTQLSLAWCKQIVHVLIGRYNSLVEKLDEIVRQSAPLSPLSKQHSLGFPSTLSGDQLSVRTVSMDLMKDVDAIFSLVEKQAVEANSLLQRVERQAIDLAAADAEKLRLQQELTVAEQKSFGLREKLSTAVSKGKSLVQHRDALKKALAEKNDELISEVALLVKDKESVIRESSEKLDAALARVHALEEEVGSLQTIVAETESCSLQSAAELLKTHSELQDRDTLLRETSQKLDLASNRVNDLEKEAVRWTDMETNKAIKVRELEELLAEAQRTVDFAELEAQSCRKTALAARIELEERQKTLVERASEVEDVIRERDDLRQSVERLKTQYLEELGESTDERDKLVNTVDELENIISGQKYDMESLMKNFEDLNRSYSSLKAQSIEDASDTTNLQDEVNSLHNLVAELQMTLEMESASRQRLEAEANAVATKIQKIVQDGSENELFANDSANLEIGCHLEDLCNALVSKFTETIREVDRLTRQISMLSDTEKYCREEESLTQMLDTKDEELRDLGRRMDEAAADMAQQEDVVQGFKQQVIKLRAEIVEVTEDRDALRVELSHSEQRTASSREKLSLAVKKGKNVVQQRDMLKQSLAEQESLLETLRAELESKQSRVSSVTEELIVSGNRIEDLQSELETLSKRISITEEALQNRDHLIKAVETVLDSYSRKTEWSSQTMTQKLSWIVTALEEAQNSAFSSSQEVEVLKRELARVRNELEDAQHNMEKVKCECTHLKSQLRDSQSDSKAIKEGSVKFESEWREAKRQVIELDQELTQAGSQLRDLRYQAECGRETMSILTKKLEKTESELLWSQQRTCQLESQLPAFAIAHQKADDLLANLQRVELQLEEKNAEVRDLESELKQRDQTISDMEQLLDQKHIDVRRAEETVHECAGRSEEAESYIRASQTRIAELELELQSCRGMQLHAEELAKEVKVLKELVDYKESSLRTMDASKSKVTNKLTSTISKFKELCQQSEGLLLELERVQGTVEAKDREINLLKEETGKASAHAKMLLARLNNGVSCLVDLEGRFMRLILSLGHVELPAVATTGSRTASGDGLADDLLLETIERVGKKFEAFMAQSMSWHVELAKKDTQLQVLKQELNGANEEKSSLKATLEREQTQFHMVQTDLGSKYPVAAQRESRKVDEIEDVQVSKRSLPSAAPHVRSTRKPPSVDVAIDMDEESTKTPELSDEKGHDFKAMASARFMPRGTRLVADRVDRIWRTSPYEATWCSLGSYLVLACNPYLDGCADLYGPFIAEMQPLDFAANMLQNVSGEVEVCLDSRQTLAKFQLYQFTEGRRLTALSNNSLL